MLGKYTSIDNHYKSVADMLGLPAVAVEKIDGSNFSVHLMQDGTHVFRSRNQPVNNHEGSMFAPAILLVEGKVEELRHNLCLESREAIVYFELFGTVSGYLLARFNLWLTWRISGHRRR